MTDRRVDEIQGEVIHVYDGIEEADNRLPTWWLVTFFGAIAFAAAYWFAFHMFGLGLHPLAAYVDEQTRALEAAGPMDDATLIELAADPKMVASGRAVFAATCVSCHGDDAAGKIGPNLTDRFWLHGGEPSQIYATIAAGVDGKGMQAWRPTLGNGKVLQLTAYVLSLRDQNRPGKEPQGQPRESHAAAPPPTKPGT